LLKRKGGKGRPIKKFKKRNTKTMMKKKIEWKKKNLKRKKGKRKNNKRRKTYGHN
jgi:hypothetical protein